MLLLRQHDHDLGICKGDGPLSCASPHSIDLQYTSSLKRTACAVLLCRQPFDASDRKESRTSRDERDVSRRKRSRSPDRPHAHPRDEVRDSERRHRDRHAITALYNSVHMFMQTA